MLVHRHLLRAPAQGLGESTGQTQQQAWPGEYTSTYYELQAGDWVKVPARLDSKPNQVSWVITKQLGVDVLLD